MYSRKTSFGETLKTLSCNGVDHVMVLKRISFVKRTFISLKEFFMGLISGLLWRMASNWAPTVNHPECANELFCFWSPSCTSKFGVTLICYIKHVQKLPFNEAVEILKIQLLHCSQETTPSHLLKATIYLVIRPRPDRQRNSLVVHLILSPSVLPRIFSKYILLLLEIHLPNYIYIQNLSHLSSGNPKCNVNNVSIFISTAYTEIFPILPFYLSCK